MVDDGSVANILDDPIGRHLSWEPAEPGGSNFKTHERVDDAVQIRFTPTIGAILFVIFICVFIGFFLFKHVTDRSSINYDMPDFLIPVFPFILFGAIAYTIYHTFKPRVFDLQQSIYRYGWFKPKIEVAHIDNRHCISFAAIHAIQVLDERVRGKNGSFISTELNLVLKDGSRMTVIDHSDRKSIIQDAKLLADKLIIPVWYRENSRLIEYHPLSANT